mgnify:CR=1 FL=1
MHDSNTTPGHEPDDRDRPEADHDSADGIGKTVAFRRSVQVGNAHQICVFFITCLCKNCRIYNSHNVPYEKYSTQKAELKFPFFDNLFCQKFVYFRMPRYLLFVVSALIDVVLAAVPIENKTFSFQFFYQVFPLHNKEYTHFMRILSNSLMEYKGYASAGAVPRTD